MNKKSDTFFSLVENLPEAIFRFDSALRYSYINPAAEKTFRLPSAASLNKSVTEVGLPPEIADTLDRSLNGVLSTGKSNLIEFEFSSPKKVRHYQTLITPEFDSSGRVQSLLCLTHDLTRWKQKEARFKNIRNELANRVKKRTAELAHSNRALKESNKFNLLLLNNSPLPVLVTNPDSSIRYANRALEKLTGFSVNELVGTGAPYLFWPPDRRTEYLEEMKNSDFNKIQVLEKTFLNRQGEEIWVELTLIPVKVNRSLRYIISTWVNLTEEKKLRRELELYSRRMMERLESERKRVADELHEDAAQSLAILSLEIDSLLQSHEIRNDKILERLRLLKDDIGRAMQIIRDYSYELRPGTLERLGLTVALEQLVDEVNEKSCTDIRFEVNGKEQNLPDETRIAFFRIAQEALSNIIRHSKATESVVRLKYSPRKTRLVIADNGKGFDLKKEREAALRGGSLGLVSMREWAKLVEAVLKIESSPGRGTSIIVEADS